MNKLEFEFQVFCSNIDSEDDAFLDRLYEAGCDDATVFFKDRYLCLDFTRSAASAEEAVMSAVADIHAAGLGLHINRLGPDDLASLADIARRVGVTRASLQKYARGCSKVGRDFPRPVQGILANRRELFSTNQVLQWLEAKSRTAVDPQLLELSKVLALANQALSLRQAQMDPELNRLLAQLVVLDEAPNSSTDSVEL